MQSHADGRMLWVCTIRYAPLVANNDVLAGALLREARVSAGLSQAELAARAGVTQSVVSVYESGHRQPALPTLAALIHATGHELDIQVRPLVAAPGRLSGPLGRRLVRRRAAVLRTVAAHGVGITGVFGSVARGDDGPDSDVDLLVTLPAGMGVFDLGRVANELEALLGARVDLVPAADLKPGVRKNVLAELVAL
jgi:predicted nucleotidyltransferase/DNA-binding XRE family transcriptional regulator